MNTEQRQLLFRQIMWDYSIPPEDVEAVLQGKIAKAGHYDKQAIFIKLLESYSWFTIVQLLTPFEIRQLLTDDVVKGLRFKSLKRQYEFVQKRLQQIVPLAG